VFDILFSTPPPKPRNYACINQKLAIPWYFPEGGCDSGRNGFIKKSHRMKLGSKEINAIAQELETGMKVYLNRETLEFKSILDWDDMDDTQFWDEEVAAIEKEWADYIILPKMNSYEAFRIMESFVDEVDDPALKNDLIKILSRRSPFSKFKGEVESSKYRQKWFDYRTKSLEDYVSELLRTEGVEFE
jgi:hypothetical protein